MKDQNEAIELLCNLSQEFIDRVNDVAELYDMDFMYCMIVEVASLTHPIIVAGMEEDLKKMIHLGDKNE